LTLFYRWERKKEKWEKKKKKKGTRANINCEENWKKMMAVLLHTYTMQWCYVGREELGASTTLFFSPLCCWGSGVFDTWAWGVVFFSLFFLFILRRWNEIEEKENKKKQMSPCYVERFACQWSLIDAGRFSYFVSLHLCIITISIYLLKVPLLFLLFRS